MKSNKPQMDDNSSSIKKKMEIIINKRWFRYSLIGIVFLIVISNLYLFSHNEIITKNLSQKMTYILIHLFAILAYLMTTPYIIYIFYNLIKKGKIVIIKESEKFKFTRSLEMFLNTFFTIIAVLILLTIPLIGCLQYIIIVHKNELLNEDNDGNTDGKEDEIYQKMLIRYIIQISTEQTGNYSIIVPFPYSINYFNFQNNVSDDYMNNTNKSIIDYSNINLHNYDIEKDVNVSCSENTFDIRLVNLSLSHVLQNLKFPQFKCNNYGILINYSDYIAIINDIFTINLEYEVSMQTNLSDDIKLWSYFNSSEIDGLHLSLNMSTWIRGKNNFCCEEYLTIVKPNIYYRVQSQEITEGWNELDNMYA